MRARRVSNASCYIYQKLNVQLNTKRPALLSLRPKSPLDIWLEPELTLSSASDHYTAPADDSSRPGVFWAVVNDPKEYGNPHFVNSISVMLSSNAGLVCRNAEQEDGAKTANDLRGLFISRNNDLDSFQAIGTLDCQDWPHFARHESKLEHYSSRKPIHAILRLDR